MSRSRLGSTVKRVVVIWQIDKAAPLAGSVNPVLLGPAKRISSLNEANPSLKKTHEDLHEHYY